MYDMIYFIADEHNRIKIGRSVNPFERLRQLQRATGSKLTLLAMEPYGRKETILHRKFAHLRIRGEWFRAGDDLVEYIKRIHILYSRDKPIHIGSDKQKQILTPADAAQLLNLLPQTIKTLCECEIIPAYKNNGLWQIQREDLVKFLQ